MCWDFQKNHPILDTPSQLSAFIRLKTSLIKQFFIFNEIDSTKDYNKKLLETIPNGIILTSSDQTVEYNNSAATLLLCEEATKNNLLNHSKNFKSLFPFIEKTTENNQYKNIEYELSNKTTLSLSTAVIPKSENQDTLLLLTDITDLKKLKQETEQKNRLVALSQMSSGISHEIGKPISDIKRDIITLNKQWDDRNQIKTIGANICDNVDAINKKTCQSLLRLGKPKPIHIIQTDIYPLLQELQSLLKAELQKKMSTFRFIVKALSSLNRLSFYLTSFIKSKYQRH